MSGIMPPLAMTMFGQTVSAAQYMKPPCVWVISHASESIAKMECGVLNPYIILRKVSEPSTMMPLHPDVIARVMATGSDSGIVLLQNNTAGVQLKHINKQVKPVLKQAEPPQEVTTEVTVSDQPKAKKGDRKEQARAIITALVGKPRKEVIQAIVAQMGMTEAGASTYHYNLTKGAWK